MNKINQNFTDELKTLESALFTQTGFEKYKSKLSEYIALLFEESLRISKRNKADSISVIHVESAANHLLTNLKDKKGNILSTVGGIFIGNAFSTLISINAFQASYSSIGISIAIILGVIGAFLMAYSLFRP